MSLSILFNPAACLACLGTLSLCGVLQGDRISSFTLKRNQAQQRLVEILRKPFRRKSVPSSPVLGVRSGGEGERGQSVPGEDKVCPITADADVDDGVLDDGLTVLPPCSVDSHTSNSSSSDGGYTTVSC